LALILEGASYGVDDAVPHFCAVVDEMEVFAACLAYDPWIARISTFGHTVGDLAIETAKY